MRTNSIIKSARTVAVVAHQLDIARSVLNQVVNKRNGATSFSPTMATVVVDVIESQKRRISLLTANTHSAVDGNSLKTLSLSDSLASQLFAIPTLSEKRLGLPLAVATHHACRTVCNSPLASNAVTSGFAGKVSKPEAMATLGALRSANVKVSSAVDTSTLGSKRYSSRVGIRPLLGVNLFFRSHGYYYANTQPTYMASVCEVVL